MRVRRPLNICYNMFMLNEIKKIISKIMVSTENNLLLKLLKLCSCAPVLTNTTNWIYKDFKKQNNLTGICSVVQSKDQGISSS